MQPADHMSHEMSQLPQSTSGEMQYGVPALVFILLRPQFEMIFERPKSIIFRSAVSDSSAKRKFSGFRSRWQTFSLWQQLSAETIYLNILAAFCSSKNSAAIILSKSSPPEHNLYKKRLYHKQMFTYSVTKQTLTSSSKYSKSLITCGWSYRNTLYKNSVEIMIKV